MPSATWMWKPVMPPLAFTISSKVLSEMANREPGISPKEAWWSKMVVTPSRMQSSTVA